MKANLVKTVKKKKTFNDCKLIITEVPETGELEIQKQATETSPERTVRFPKEISEQYKLSPKEFINVQNAIEAVRFEEREVTVYANSIESRVGYDSLIRIMDKFFGKQMAYLRSEKGGSLSLEEARERVYQRHINDEEAVQLLDSMLRTPTDRICFADLLSLHENSPAMAENVWEMIKREAQRSFESGHRAAEAFEPADYMKDAWNRASYIGFRESLCEEWRPKGGIELSMIDAIAQAWLQLQFWTEESVKRAKTEPREENYEFLKWKTYNKQANPKQWSQEGDWDIPYVGEQAAIERAAQMADRWQRMYFRAIRNLRDWRRYTPQVTINNANQVNIATDGGQQVNVSNIDNTRNQITAK